MHSGGQGRSSGPGFYVEEEEEEEFGGRSRGYGGPSASTHNQHTPSRTRTLSESFEPNDYKEEAEVGLYKFCSQDSGRRAGMFSMIYLGAIRVRI